MLNELDEIMNVYGLDHSKYVGHRQISVGHINTTVALYFDQGNVVKRYLLQEINTNVFKDPEALMANINRVTTYGYTLLKNLGVPNAENRMLRILKTPHGETFYKTKNGRVVRIYHYIEGSISFNKCEDKKIYYSAGQAIGYFQNLLSAFPHNKLTESIPNFHNTPMRYTTFLSSLSTADKKTVNSCLEEINFFKDNKYISDSIQPLLDKGEMPMRVTHNDTKMNNIMFNYNNHEGLCLIDLDTVMPGSAVYDFGDFVRSGCNMGEEDSKDLSTIHFNDSLYMEFAKGYVTSMLSSITEIEIKNLTMGAILITYECGLRFLTDYLDGNKYFKVEYPEHNLIRARTQIEMVKQLLSMKDELDSQIMAFYKSQLD